MRIAWSCFAQLPFNLNHANSRVKNGTDAFGLDLRRRLYESTPSRAKISPIIAFVCRYVQPSILHDSIRV